MFVRHLALLALVMAANGCKREVPVVELESVADAPSHFEDKRLSFSGTLREDLLGEHSWRNASSNRGTGAPGSELFMIVVPVVPDGWTKDKPVPMWLTPSNKESKPKHRGDWLKRAARVQTSRETGKVVDYADREPGMRKESGWQKAIDAAEAEHGLKSDPHAPIVQWPESG